MWNNNDKHFAMWTKKFKNSFLPHRTNN